jgi:hypothetical protein
MRKLTIALCSLALALVAAPALANGNTFPGPNPTKEQVKLAAEMPHVRENRPIHPEMVQAKEAVETKRAEVQQNVQAARNNVQNMRRSYGDAHEYTAQAHVQAARVERRAAAILGKIDPVTGPRDKAEHLQAAAGSYAAGAEVLEGVANRQNAVQRPPTDAKAHNMEIAAAKFQKMAEKQLAKAIAKEQRRAQQEQERHEQTQ